MTLTLVHRGVGGLHFLPLELGHEFVIALMNWMGRKYHSMIFEIVQLLPGLFFYRMLTLGTQPPCCEKAQTSPCGETTWRGSCGEKLRPPADSGHQLPDTWVNEPSDDSRSQPLCSPGRSPNIRHGGRDKSSPLCPVLIPDPENPWAE